ncbi:hypothetical protein H5410_002509, partial [Solanum commersonii]
MSAHNKTQFTYARINCVLKDSSCDTPYQIFSCSQYLPLVQVNQFKIKNQMQRPHSKRGTQCMFSPI